MPSEFRGVKPKLLVKKDDKVKIGSPLFYDKSKPEVKWASPGCGTIKDIVFGARRVIEKIDHIEKVETSASDVLAEE